MELHLYDFDGTLFRSPLPPASWPNEGSWWSDSTSLSAPCVPDKPGGGWWFEPVVAAAKASIASPDVLAILCTGRSSQSFARFRVPELLRIKGLDFDQVYLKPGITTSSEAFKKGIIQKLLGLYPDITTVHIYEDRGAHLNAYCQMVKGMGLVCIPHLIKGPESVCEEAAIQRVASRWLRASLVAVSG